MKVQDEERAGELRRRRRVVIQGSSVEVSGKRSGVNCERGYIVVFAFGSGDVLREERTWIRVLRTTLDSLMKRFGEASGEGARLDSGQERMYPAGTLVSGITKKLRFETALWILAKYSVTSFEEKRWYRSWRLVK